MSAGHFFVGLSAGVAILAVPVLMLTPGSQVPQHLIDWIEGPPPTTAASSDTVAVSRPLSGYQAGDPTPAPQAVPTIQPLSMPTPVARPTPQPIVSAPPLSSLRWAGTAVIRSGGMPVYVRQIAGVDSGNDPIIPDGSPVLVSSGPPLQVGPQQWRAVRGLNGIVGWVPTAQVAVDGEAPPAPLFVGLTPTAVAGAPQRGVIANTDGSGVVLRNSPNDADRSHSGLMDGVGVTVLEWSGTEWVHVRADNGETGWVPVRYVNAVG